MPSEKVAAAYAELSLKKEGFDSGLDSANSKFNSVAGSMESRAGSLASSLGGAMKTAAIAIGAASVGAATAGLMSFKDLEGAASSAASKSVDVNGKSVEQIKAQYDSLQAHVIDISRQLGQATVFDPTDVASAFDALAGAGQDVAKIGKSELLPFLNLAASDMKFGLGNTTELMMSYMNGFGLSMKDSGKMADMLSKGVNGSNASLETYLLAMREGGAVAAGANMPLNEFLATVGKLADHSITGAAAGDALKTAIMSLGSPSKAQTDALKKLGLTYDDVNPRTHKFIDTLALLKERGADVIDFGNIFTQSSGAVMNWAAKDAAAIKELSGSISDSGGLAQSMSDLIMGSDKLTGAFEQAKGSTSDLFIALGQYLAPAATQVLNAWTALVPKIEEFGAAIAAQDWNKVGKMLSDGIGAGLEIVKNLLTSLGSFITSLPWASWFSKAGNAIISQPWGSWASQAINLLGQGIQLAISIALNIGGWIQEKVGGWISAGGPRKLGQDIADAIGNAIQSFFASNFDLWYEGVVPAFQTVYDWVKLGWEIVKGIGQGLLDRMYAAVQPAANKLLASFATASYEIQGTFARSWNTILVGAANLVSGVYAAFSGVGEKIAGYLKPATDAFSNLSSAADNAIRSSISAGGSGPGGGTGKVTQYLSDTGAVVKAEDAEAYRKKHGGKVNLEPYAYESLQDTFASTYDSNAVTFGGYKTGGKGFISSELQSAGSDKLYMITDKGDFVTLTGKETVAKSIFDLIAPYTADYVTNSAVAGQAWADKVMPVGDKIVSSEKEASTTQQEAAKAAGAGLKEDAKTSGGYWSKSGQDMQNVINYAAQTAWGSITKAAGAVEQAGATAANTLSAAAQNSLTIGNAISAKMQGAGEAVRIGLTAGGQQIAVIGQVAQSQFAAAGGQFLNAANQAGAATTGAASRASSLIQGVTSGFSSAGSAVSGGLQSGASALQGAAGAVNSAAAKLNSSGGVGNVPYGPANPNANKSTGTSGKTYPTWMTDAVPWLAGGKETSGPEMALIGEDGKEFVIPTKTKRWDLLLAAMKAYGIRGMAEGGAAGTGGAGTGEADQMQAYFGIQGLASMSKSVQKIINDLKDFFRISWAIIKAEGSTYWKAINAIITSEATTTRNNAWQAALDIRNTWLSSNQQIVADATATYAGLWTAIEPGVKSIHDGIIYSFQDSGSQVKALMDQMGSDAMISLQSFQTSWNTVWTQMLADLQNTASQITSILTDLGAKVGSITVNASVNVGGGGGSYGGSADMTGSGGGDISTSGDVILGKDGSANFKDVTCTGNTVLVNALKYTNPSGQISYINPLTYLAQGGISNYQSNGYSGGITPSSTGSGYTGGMSLAYGSGFSWSAKGALIDTPQRVIVGEAGPELILPAKLTRMFLNLAEGGGAGPVASRSIVIEDHTVHHWYMDGKEVTNQIMKNATKQLRLKGAISVR